MFERIKSALIPHLIGLIIIVLGWYISILNVGLNRFQPDVLFTKWTGFGLLMILVGAYLPEVYLGIKEKSKK